MKAKHLAPLLLMLVLALACSSALAAGSTHTVTFDAQGDLPAGTTATNIPTSPQTVADGNTVQQPSNPSAEGYRFLGWYTSLTETDAYNFGAAVTNDLTLVAKWERIQYTVTFVYQDGATSDTTENVYHGEKVAKPADPTRTGYGFSGWYTDPTCAPANRFEFDATSGKSVAPVTSNITLYAGWNINQYTVTFDSQGHGVTPPEQTVNHGQKVTNPGSLAAQGWVFGGWYTDASCADNTLYDFDAVVTSAFTLYAKWTQQYTVTFEMNGHGPVNKKQTVTSGEKVSRPATDPTAEGYAFDNWYSDPDFNNEFDFNTTITADTTIYAKWTATVTVTFQWRQATNGSAGALTGGAKILLLVNGVGAIAGQNGVDDPYRTLSSGTSATWTGLSADPRIRYSVSATNVPPNYTAVCSQQAENSFLVTYVENEKLTVSIRNTHEVDKIDMVISKEWQDNNNQHRPDSIQVQLKKMVNGQAEPVLVNDANGNPQPVVVTLNAGNNWTGHLPGLYMREAGETIQYVIEEISDVPGYTATCSIQVDQNGNYTVVVTNVLTGKVDISGKKIWDDDNNRDGIRPDSIQLKIYENALIDPDNLVKIMVVQPSSSEISTNEWSWTVQDLPVYDKYGRTIMYIVVEDPVPNGYTSSGPQYVPIPVNSTGGGSGN